MVCRAADVVAHSPPGGPGDLQDGDRDQDADDRVEDRHAGCDGGGGGDDGQRDVGVGPGVVAVGDQGGRVQALAGAAPDPGGGPVAQIADHPGGGEDCEV